MAGFFTKLTDALGNAFSPSNRLPVQTEMVQPLTDTQLRASAVKVNPQNQGADISTLNPVAVQTVNRVEPKQLKFFTPIAASGAALTNYWDMTNHVAFTLSIAGGALQRYQVFGSNDTVTWYSVDLVRMDAGLYRQSDTFGPGFVGTYYGNRLYAFYKVVCTNAVSSNTLFTVNLLTSTLPVAPRSFSEPAANKWTYTSPTGGITAASTNLKVANSPYVQIVIYQMTLRNIGTAGTEFSIKGGSTTIFSSYIKAGETWELSRDRIIYSTVGANAVHTLELASTTNVQIYANIDAFDNIG